jgi:hypothetical protein
MYGAELTVQVITVPQLRTVPTHAYGITWEPIPLPLLPCPQIDRCQESLSVTRIPERRSNDRDALRAGNDSNGGQHRVVSQRVLFNQSFLPWPKPVGRAIDEQSTHPLGLFPQANFPHDVSVGWIDDTDPLGVSSHLPQRGAIRGQACSHLQAHHLL